MEIWLDTIDYDVIADGVRTGVIAGVTTNPSILAHASDVRATLSKLLEIQPGPVAVQVTSTTPEEMVEEGLSIFELSPRMVVKVPVNHNGLIAIKELLQENVTVLGTGILLPSQALLAANHGATYIAPYFGRMGEVGDGTTILKTIVEILTVNASPTRILVASLREIDQIIFCATLGVSAITIKPDLYYKLVANHPVVEGLMQKFSSEWEKKQGKTSLKELLAASKSLAVQ